MDMGGKKKFFLEKKKIEKKKEKVGILYKILFKKKLQQCSWEK
jgi:hypothetical protein